MCIYICAYLKNALIFPNIIKSRAALRACTSATFVANYSLIHLLKGKLCPVVGRFAG